MCGDTEEGFLELTPTVTLPVTKTLNLTPNLILIPQTIYFGGGKTTLLLFCIPVSLINTSNVCLRIDQHALKIACVLSEGYHYLHANLH